MASNPPFQVEDQTDEDFFDKLVDDDYKPATSLNIVDGSDSDEVKAFANLSISDTGTGLNMSENAVEEDVTDGGVEASGGEDLKGDVVDSSVNPSESSLVSSNSFAFDGVFDSDNGVAGVGSTPGFTESENVGSGASGIKEVQWSAFSADSAQNGSNGFGSFSDFFTEIGDGSVGPVSKGTNLISESNVVSGSEVGNSACIDNSNNGYTQFQEAQLYGTANEQNSDGQDVNSTQYWENLYPGWKYDANTGLWYQIDGGYDATTTNVQGGLNSNDWSVTSEKAEVSYSQQTSQFAVEGVAEKGTTESVTSWNPVSQTSDTNESLSNWNQPFQENNGYPSHMVFDPQYPGWYYDMLAQEWRSLDTYNSESTAHAHDQLNQNGLVSDGISHNNDQKNYGEHGQADTYSQGQDYKWNGSYANVSQQSSNMWKTDVVAKNVVTADFAGNQQVQHQYGSNLSLSNHVPQQNSYDYGGMTPSYESTTQGRNDYSGVSGSQGFVPGGNFAQQFNQTRQNEQLNVSNDYYRNDNQLRYAQQPVHGGYSNQPLQSGFTQKPVHGGFSQQPVQSSFSQQPVQGGYSPEPVHSGFSHQPVQSGQQFSYAPADGRSSAGRPPHALVTFGFGGKLIVMKDSTSLGASSYGSHDSKGGSVSVLNLAEVVSGGADSGGASDYFNTLCRQTLPSPLTGGSASSKELNKWIDERIAYCESPNMDYRKGEVLRLLLSLLKIASQHYGKFRSPFGTDTASKENDAPEIAVARLFASARKNGAQCSEYGALANCLQTLPSEGQMRVIAAEVQTLLVSGRKKEALHCAQEGHLWGPALVLAAQLGDQYYVDTVKQMALCQLVAGSPLRTLCLLIAGQPADVFSADTAVNNSMPSVSGQVANSMLDDWEENLAVITANRTKDDELVLIHLGDCLWKEKSDIIAAHICYLVAEANFEPYSDTARLCLIGADHWKFPRTYASPEAIQRTEVFEYSKLLGNSQFTLLPFQPYKLIYAHMLAEVGRVSDSLKYCQAVSKSLKTGRAPEVEILRQFISSLEERIKTHQQGGFSTNLAPGKLVGKIFNFFDSTAHRVVGGLPPPAPSTSVANAHTNEHHYQSSRVSTSQSTQAMSSLVPSASTSVANAHTNEHHYQSSRVSTSQSTLAMSSLVPSASMEPITERTADSSRRSMHNRSVSEPDFGRTPRQSDSSKDASMDSQSKASGGSSRFGRFGFGSQLIQKTVGLVLKPRQDKQAKLGESNKFYYDEQLKRWVEEGAEPPAEEVAPPPPPTMATFQNGTSDYNLNNALKSEGSQTNGSPEFRSPTALGRSSGIPPIPTTSNQFSARGRVGVRARYVDTFSKGGGNPTNLFQSPAATSIKPATAGNPKFFVPAAAVPAPEQSPDTSTDYTQQPPPAAINENQNASGPTMNDSFHSPPHPNFHPSVTMQRYPSMDNISNRSTGTNMNNNNGPLSSHSRRTASWSGSFSDGFSPPTKSELKPLGEVLGMPPSSFMPTSEQALTHSSMNGGSFNELQEVEL